MQLCTIKSHPSRTKVNFNSSSNKAHTMAETLISKFPSHPNLSALEDDLDFPPKHLKSEEPSIRRKRSWMDYIRGKSGSLSRWNTPSTLSRFQGAVLNRIIRTGMQTPLVKYLLNPQTLKKALNKDPILSETYKIILTSDPVQNLLTPEAMKIILDSATAKEVITPEMITTILNSDLLVNFITAENIQFILGTQVVKKVLAPQALHQYLETKAAKNFLQPEVVHEIAYSQVFTDVMIPEILVGFVNTEGIKAVMTPEAIVDTMESEAARNTMNQEMIDKLLETQGAQNLLGNEMFLDQTERLFKTIFSK